MAGLNLRITGSDDDARLVANLLTSVEGIEHVEHINDLMPQMDDPALAGRAFLLASYALFMTTWVVPSSLTSVIGADATTMATPLSYMKAGEALPQYFTYKSMFLGTMPGCIG